MDTNITVAIISAAGAVIVGLAAIGSNTFWIGRSLDGVGHRLLSIERRLEVIETDLKQFFQVQSQHDKDIQRLKDKTGLA